MTSYRNWFNAGAGSLISSLITYDIAGNVLSVTDPNGYTSTLTYNDDGSNQYAFPTHIKNALNQLTVNTYDYNAGKVSSVTDPNNNKTSYAYNEPLDRLTQVALPTGAQTNISYASPVWTIVYQDKDTPGDGAIQTQTVLDGLGRTLEQRTLEGGNYLIATDTGYDALGRVWWQSNPSRVYIPTWTPDGLAYQTFYSYDSLGRVASVSTPDGGVTRTSYSGNTATVYDPGGWYAHQSTTDGLGRLLAMVEDYGNTNLTTQYAHDPLGNLVWVNKCAASGCQSGQARGFGYDSLGRLNLAINPESGTTNYTYDSASNLQTKTDARGIATTYSYDHLNRLTGKTYSDGVTPNVTYTWDTAPTNGIGRLAVASKSTGSINYTGYDSAGHLTSSNQQTPSWYYTFGYTYNLAGALTNETYPSGRVLATAFDLAGRPSGVSDSGNAYVSSVSYWPHGAANAYVYGNNVVPVFTYDTVLEPFQNYATIGNNQNNWLLYLGNTWSTNATLGYVDEGVGTSVVWNNMNWFSQSYSYDPLKRLTYAFDYYSGNVGWGRNYAYDEYGNASVSVNLGVPLNGLTPVKTGNNWFNNPYNPANNQLLAESYDAAGNTTNIGSLTVTYDAEAMQTQTYDSVSHLQANYTYDANGQRVQKIFNGVTTLYVHDALGTLAAEYSSAAATTPACTTCYLSYDHLGSVRLITDQNASIVSRHDFQPFGEEIFAGTAETQLPVRKRDGSPSAVYGPGARSGEYAVSGLLQCKILHGRAGKLHQPRPSQRGCRFDESAELECVRVCAG